MSGTIERAAESSTLARSRPMLWSLLALLLALLPALGLYAATLLRQGYLLRRDETIMLAILAALRRGDTDGLFLMSISPAAVAVLRAAGALFGPVAGGRLLALLSALACALFVAAIARRLYGRGPVAPLSAAVLMSSALFVHEGTLIRPNLAALAFGLSAVLAALAAAHAPLPRALALLALAGLLAGVAVQVKALALAMTPLAPLLVWPLVRGTLAPLGRLRAACTAAGALAVGAFASAALLALLLGGGSRLAQILGSHLAAATLPLPQRLAHNGAVAGEALGAHAWMALLFAAGVATTVGGREGRERAALLLVWGAGVVVMLLANFPSWDHHYVFLLPPLAIGAAAAAVQAAASLGGAGERAGPALAMACLVLAMAGASGAAATLDAEAPGRQEQAVARLIAARTPPGATIWSDNLIFPLMTDRPAEPALADLSMKRIIAGQLREHQLFALVARREPAAIIYYDGLFDAFPTFTACLEAALTPTPIALGGQRIYWLAPGDGARLQACGAAHADS